MGIPNVKLVKFKVAITGLLMTVGGGNRKGIVWTREEPNSLVISFGDVVVVVAMHDVATIDDVAVAVGAVDVVDV